MRSSTKLGTRKRIALAAGTVLPVLAIGLAQTTTATAQGAAVYVGDLVDLQPTRTDALDGATAGVTVVEREGSTYVTFRLQHIDRTAATRTFGAHLHTGACVAGNGAAAGPHYNDDVARGVATPGVSRDTEVWLDFQVNAGGAGHALVSVPFTVQPGLRAIVVHALPTAPGGAAGDRLACIPVDLR